MNIYDVINLRTVNRCKYETLYKLLPKGGLSQVLILKLQVQVVLRQLRGNKM
jgi:hypothetical protein